MGAHFYHRSRSGPPCYTPRVAGTRRFEHDGIEGLRVGLVPGQVNTTCIVYRLGSTVIDTGPPNQWRKVRRILEEDFGTIFCSHRGVVPSGKEALRRKLDFLESLRERVLHFHGEGLSVREITRRVLGREGMMPWMTGFHFSKKNLVEACLEAGE